jgi:branched-chain amino acid transport system substrate-binding protein
MQKVVFSQRQSPPVTKGGIPMKKICLSFVVAWVAASATLTSAQTSPVSSDAIRIHHIGPFTGPLTNANKEALSGAKLYLSKINAAGGVSGRKIEIVEADDKQDAKVTEQLVGDLIARKGALAFFMPRTSPSNLAMLKLTEPAGIPIVAPQVGPDFLYDEKQKSAFTVRASYAAEQLRALELQLRLGRTSFAFLTSDDAYGNPLLAVATKKLAEVNLKPTFEKVDNRNANLEPALAKFVAAKPDVIFLLCSATCASDFVNKYVERGGATQFVTLSNNSSNSFVKGMGKNARGVIVMQVVPLPTSKTIGISKEYAAAAAAAKLEPSHASLQGYISARLLVEGLRRAGRSVSSSSLAAALESLRNFDLGDFVLSYGVNDRVGSAFIEDTIISKDGKFLR